MKVNGLHTLSRRLTLFCQIFACYDPQNDKNVLVSSSLRLTARKRLVLALSEEILNRSEVVRF